MKAASLSEIKHELHDKSKLELLELCTQLSRFKKENKELLTYLLFESHDESAYIQGIGMELEKSFSEINTDSYYYIKKSVRKILRRIKTYIRYSKKKETEIELLILFCRQLKNMKPSYAKNVSLINLYNRQLSLIEKALLSLHEDLQYDYKMVLDEL